MFIALPTEKIKLGMDEENETLQEGAKVDDGLVAKEKSHIILMDLIPALARGDIFGVGRVIWKMQTLGSKATEIAVHGKNILPAMKHLFERVEGVAATGMSSIGPAVVIVTKQSKGFIEQELKCFDMKLSYSTRVDNQGHSVHKLP